ncbi:MAG: BTAD domain-containing putative transcriptional regulator, partial [Thermomicrobiales bacterium]
MHAPTPLAVHLLGGFTVVVAGRALPADAWGQRRAAAVVKLLALQPQRRLHREHLMETLWPDLASDAAANNLRVAVHRARQRLEAAGATGRVLTREHDDVVLGDPAETWVDVDAFTGAVQRAWLDDDPATAERAADLYRGDLLPEDPYEEWAAHRRTDLRVSYLALLTRLGQLHDAGGDTSAAIAAVQRLLAAEPLEEAGHAALMRLYSRVGARRQAMAQYDTLATLLAQELDAAPDPATTALRDEIGAMTEEVVFLPWHDPSLAMDVMSPLVHTGTVDPDLVGRERELAELERLLGKHRLLTLTGPAGAGKSRLAEAALQRAAARGEAGLVVELDAVPSPDLLLTAIAGATGATVPETDATLEAVIAQLGHTPLLLVLDTFEHLLPAAEVVAGLVRGCPRLSLLVTSRERLRLRAEHIY